MKITKRRNYGNRRIARRVQRHTRSRFYTHWKWKVCRNTQVNSKKEFTKWENWRLWVLNLGHGKVAEIHKLIRGTILPDGKVDEMEKLTAPGIPACKYKNSWNTQVNPRRKWSNGKITEISELHAECNDTHVQHFIHIFMWFFWFFDL